jgi:Putative Ig domain
MRNFSVAQNGPTSFWFQPHDSRQQIETKGCSRQASQGEPEKLIPNSYRSHQLLLPLFLALISLACAQVAVAQRCLLVPDNPVAVPAGGSYSFSAYCGTGVTWTLTGQGTLNNGNYTAPASVRAQNQDRGCQVSPNNSVFNVPVNTLPVDAHSTRWLNRVAEDGVQYPSPDHNIKFFPEDAGFYSNVVNANSQQQLMHFIYTVESNGYQDTNFPMPSQRTAMVETGANVDPGGGWDRHLFTINSNTCTATEIYNAYVDFRTSTFTPANPTQVSWTTNSVWNMPQLYQVVITGGTGAWAAANGTWRLTSTGHNSGTLPFDSSQWGPAPSGTSMTTLGYGCPTCNAQSGQQFSPASYAELGGVDAAGMAIGALSVKMEEWYAATQAGRTDLGHAIRTTISNSYLSARNIWPATLYATGVAGMPMPITQVSNASQAIVTSANDLSQSQPCDNYTYTPGCRFYVNVSGIAMGNPWAVLDGDQTATAIDNFHFSIPLNTSGLGTYPGGASFVFDFFPYGATVRLKSSVDLDGLCTSTDLNNWCPYAKVYLNTLKNYGMIIADGTVPSDNWDNGIITSEFHPNVLFDAANNIKGWAGLQPIEPYLEVVNRSSQQVYTDLGRYQASNVNRTTVQVCGSYGCDSADILLQGTTIGTDHERLLVAANTSYQLNVWLNGNVNTSFGYAIDQGIPGSAVSSSGMLTMPNCPTKQKGMVTVTSNADPDALPLYIEVGCLPVSADGSYRLALGNYSGDYVDSHNYTWWGSWSNWGFDSFYEAPALEWGSQTGTWQGFAPCANDNWTGTDSQLYSRSTSLLADTKVELVLPNGGYNLTLYGEPGFGGFGPNNTCGNTAGMDVYDWTVQGQTAGSWLDGYILAGGQSYNGYQLHTQTTVSDNVLDTIGRIRVVAGYGMSWSSLLISPTSAPPPLTITTTTLPHSYWVLPYRATVTASGGAPPYTWSIVPGSGYLPPGYSLNASSGLISGNTPLAGTFSFTVEVTDSQQNTATQPLSIKVCIPGHNC